MVAIADAHVDCTYLMPFISAFLEAMMATRRTSSTMRSPHLRNVCTTSPVPTSNLQHCLTLRLVHSPLIAVYDRCGVSPLAPPAEQIPPGALFETRNGHTIEIISHHTPPGSASQDEGGTVSVHFHGSSSHLEIDLVELQKAILRRIEVPPPARNCRDGEEVNDEIESNATDKATKSAPEKSVSSPLENDMAATLLKLGSAPVLEWPPKQSGTNSGGPDQEEICQGLSLHRKLCNESPDVVKIPASSVVDNPRDIRPGCTYRMWDPAGVYNYLSWDPYASTVVSTLRMTCVQIHYHRVTFSWQLFRAFSTLHSASFVVSTKTITKVCSAITRVFYIHYKSLQRVDISYQPC